MSKLKIKNANGVWESVAPSQKEFDNVKTQLAETGTLLKNLSVDVTDKQFGAKGDGITNDSKSIQSAIDFVNNKGGGTVYFPGGTYMCNVLLKPHVSLVGENQYTTVLKSVAGSNRDVIKSWDFDVMTESPSGTRPTKVQATRYNRLENLTVDGNYQNNTSGSGVSVYGCFQFWKNIYVQNCREYGIRTEYGSQSTVDITGRDDMRWNMPESVFEKITINGCDLDGWLYRGTHDSTVKDIIITRCLGWGFNQDSEYGNNNGLKLHNANIYLVGNGLKINTTCQLSGDTRLDNNNKGIGLLFKYDTDSAKASQFVQASNLFLSGWDTALDISGTYHNINAIISNCGNNLANTDSSAIVLRNMSTSKLTIVATACKKYVHIDTTKTLGSGNQFTLNFTNVSGQSYFIDGNLASQDFIRMTVTGNPSADIIQEPYDTIKSRGASFVLPNTAPGTLLTTTLAPSRSANARGGVLMQTATPDLTANPTMSDFNALLAKLRSAGVISST